MMKNLLSHISRKNLGIAVLVVLVLLVLTSLGGNDGSESMFPPGTQVFASHSEAVTGAGNVLTSVEGAGRISTTHLGDGVYEITLYEQPNPSGDGFRVGYLKDSSYIPDDAVKDDKPFNLGFMSALAVAPKEVNQKDWYDVNWAWWRTINHKIPSWVFILTLLMLAKRLTYTHIRLPLIAITTPADYRISFKALSKNNRPMAPEFAVRLMTSQTGDDVERFNAAGGTMDAVLERIRAGAEGVVAGFIAQYDHYELVEYMSDPKILANIVRKMYELAEEVGAVVLGAWIISPGIGEQELDTLRASTEAQQEGEAVKSFMEITGISDPVAAANALRWLRGTRAWENWTGAPIAIPIE